MDRVLLWIVQIVVAASCLKLAEWYIFGLSQRRIPKIYKSVLSFAAIILAVSTVFYVPGLNENSSKWFYWFGYGIRFVGYLFADLANGFQDLGTFFMQMSNNL